MEARALKAEFGRRVAFHGGISIQRTLPFGTPREVRDTVRDTIAALAPGGGYLFGTAHNIQADTPLKNFEALLAAFRDYARYS
jgi:uroporphyrinogen decarboxylase